MKEKITQFKIFFLISFIFIISVYSADVSQVARDYYINAMTDLGQEKKEEALVQYEKALFEDSKILAFDDKGLLSELKLKYLKEQNKESSPENLYKLGFLFKISGEYEKALSFFNKNISDYPENNPYFKLSTQMSYEITTLLDVKEKQNRQEESADNKDVEVVLDDKEKKQEVAVSQQTEDKDLESKISQQQDKVEKLQKDYDLWFSLKYGEHKQPKENYYEAMIYYYEDKLEKAKEELKKLEENK